MRRTLAAVALAALGALGNPGSANAVCGASVICAINDCTGTVNVCPTADYCRGFVNVCPGADRGDCDGNVDVCDVTPTIACPYALRDICAAIST